MTTVKVRYVGSKEFRPDTVAGTGIVWRGHGDIQDVPLPAWPKLSKHPDIWERVEDTTTPPAPQGKAG